MSRSDGTDPSPLAADLQRVLELYRVGAAPSEPVRARLWLRLAGPGVGGVMGASTLFRVIAGGLLGGTLLAVGVNVSRDDRQPSAPSISEPVPIEAHKQTPPPVALPPARPTPVVPDAPPAPTVSSTKRPGERRPSTPMVAPEQPSTLAAEIALLERARIAVGRGRTQEALALLIEHKREFSAGVLAEERNALRIVALCKSEDAPKGKAEAGAFLGAHPQAALAARVRAACGTDR